MELEMCTTEPRSMQSISILNQFFFKKQQFNPKTHQRLCEQAGN